MVRSAACCFSTKPRAALEAKCSSKTSAFGFLHKHVHAGLCKKHTKFHTLCYANFFPYHLGYTVVDLDCETQSCFLCYFYTLCSVELNNVFSAGYSNGYGSEVYGTADGYGAGESGLDRYDGACPNVTLTYKHNYN